MDKDTIRTILCYIRKHTFLVVLSLVLAAVTVVSTLYPATLQDMRSIA